MTAEGGVSVLSLSSEECESIATLATHLADISPSGDAEGYVARAQELCLCLPERILTELRRFARHGSPTGFLLIEKILVDDEALGNTPPGNIYRAGEATALSRAQALLVSCIANMISYEAEGYGRLFQDVVPVQAMAAQQTSNGSAIELEIHTEQAFSRLKPDVLSLACLRGDSEAKTHILPVQFILDNLAPEECVLLREPLWTVGVDLSFKMSMRRTNARELEFLDGDCRGPMPIIRGTESDPLLVFDQDLMKGVTPEAQALIPKIVSIYYKTRLSHELQPGQIILVDNRRAVHGRSPFHPRWDGRDRFLVRCFGVFDWEATAYARPGGGRMAAAVYS